MSHEATTWAIRQRGISPAAKLVLWHLADRFHPDHGCFPSQKTLAEDCEMPRSSLNNHLDALEQAGLIRREARIDEATKKQLPTRYRLRCERGFQPAQASGASAAAPPADEAGTGPAEGESRVQNLDTAPEKPCPENRGSRVHAAGHGYNDKPVSEPVRFERERARDPAGERTSEGGQGPTEVRSEPANQKADGDPTRARTAPGGPSPDGRDRGGGDPADLFEAFRAAWPTSQADSAARTRAEWDRLGLDDRAAALAGVPAFLDTLKRLGRKHVPAGMTYLAERRWIAPAAPGAAATAAGVAARPFTADWWAVLWGRIAAGQRQRAGFMVSEAERGCGVTARPEDIAAGRPAHLRACPSDGTVWPVWRDWLRARGHRLPAFADARVWVFLPGPTPPDAALAAPGEALFSPWSERSVARSSEVRSATATTGFESGQATQQQGDAA